MSLSLYAETVLTWTESLLDILYIGFDSGKDDFLDNDFLLLSPVICFLDLPSGNMTRSSFI